MFASPSLRRARVILLSLFAAGVLLVLSALRPLPALAATEGVMIDYGGWTVGSSLLDSGETVYCIEPGAGPPDGPQESPLVVSELRGYTIQSFNGTGWNGWSVATPVSGEPLRRINYVLSRYGQTADAREAVAVQFAIWLLREQPGEEAMLAHHIAWVEAHGGAAEIARAWALVAEARETAVAAPSLVPGAPVLARGEAFGEGTVSYSAGTTELTITGGTFANGLTRVALPGDAAGTLDWRADMHQLGWQREHVVRVTGAWSMSDLGWPAQVQVYPAADPVRQTLSWAVGSQTETRSGTFAEVSLAVDARFSPVLSTAVQSRAITEAGAALTDRVRLDLANASAPWPVRLEPDGTTTYLPLRVHGVLYGPFTEAQREQSAVPTDAPVAARAELNADMGPGEYTVSAPRFAAQNGYYYWVWTIDEALQDPVLRASTLLAPGFQYSDPFGQQSEEHVVKIPQLAVTGAEIGGPQLGWMAVTVMSAGGILLGVHVVRRRNPREQLRSSEFQGARSVH